MAEIARALVDKYPIVSIEDPLGENGADGCGVLRRAGGRVQIVVDDFLVTNADG